DPKRQRSPMLIAFRVAVELLAPVPEQDQAGRNRVKQTTLGHEHGERNAFPGDVVDVLIVFELKIPQELKTGDAAIEKKTGDGERSTPAIKGVECRNRREKT